MGRPMSGLLRHFTRDESGEAAVEYGLIAACLSIAIATVMQGIGTRLTTTFDAVESALK